MYNNLTIMKNGKIYEWLRKNCAWLFWCFISVCLGIVLLHSCQNGNEFSVKNNRVIVTKSKNK